MNSLINRMILITENFENMMGNNAGLSYIVLSSLANSCVSLLAKLIPHLNCILIAKF